MAGSPLADSGDGSVEAIRAAHRLGARRIVLAIGGSTSSDGGMGVLTALGAMFVGGGGRQLAASGGNLMHVHSVGMTELLDLSRTEIVVASDVQNPLIGPRGAAYVSANKTVRIPSRFRFWRLAGASRPAHRRIGMR